MARLGDVTREELNPEDHQYYDSISGSRGSVRGPYGVLLNSPDLAARVAHTGAFVRFNLDLPESLKETVIITTAREIKNQYEAGHARLGVSDEAIAAIANGSAPDGLSGEPALLVSYTKELLQDRKVSDATYQAVVDQYGVGKTVEITALIGHYLLVGQILAAFQVDLPEGVSPEIPD